MADGCEMRRTTPWWRFDLSPSAWALLRVEHWLLKENRIYERTRKVLDQRYFKVQAGQPAQSSPAKTSALTQPRIHPNWLFTYTFRNNYLAGGGWIDLFRNITFSSQSKSSVMTQPRELYSFTLSLYVLKLLTRPI